jgi:hypothetical protein
MSTSGQLGTQAALRRGASNIEVCIQPRFEEERKCQRLTLPEIRVIVVRLSSTRPCCRHE